MNCLLCYTPLKSKEIDYHSTCLTKAFGSNKIPEIDLDENKLVTYATKIIAANKAITGVQPKLSLWLEISKKNLRFTIVDEKSNYIIKPQSSTYKALPENEDLCMHLANELGIKTAQHCLIRLKNRDLAYITKRFDRDGLKKLASEDLCQLSETLTEHKYRGSYEKIGKTIMVHSSQQGLDALHFFQLVIFSFIIGNADMHLKNFSMLENELGSFCLSPAYDLVSTALVIKKETEQMSLNLNGKKNKLTKTDFDKLGASLSLSVKQIENCYTTLTTKTDRLFWWVDNSFLPLKQKQVLSQLILKRSSLFHTSKRK